MILYSTAALVAAGFALTGIAKLIKAPAMVVRAEHAGFSVRAYQLIGAAEVAGALGVLAGLRFPVFGYAAGACLFLLMAGAVLTHIRLGDKLAELAPAMVFTLAIAAYLIALGAGR